MTLAVFAMALAGTASCAPTNLAQVIEAASKDQATMCWSIAPIPPYFGGAQGARTNIENGTVKCNKDGLEVGSQPTVIPVGVQVVPAK